MVLAEEGTELLRDVIDNIGKSCSIEKKMIGKPAGKNEKVGGPTASGDRVNCCCFGLPRDGARNIVSLALAARRVQASAFKISDA